MFRTTVPGPLVGAALLGVMYPPVLGSAWQTPLHAPQRHLAVSENLVV